MKIKLYTTNCPKCIVLKRKLEEKNIEPDEVISDLELIVAKGITSVPYLEIKDKMYNFSEAIKWVGEQGGG